MKHKLRYFYGFAVLGGLFWALGCATVSTDKKIDTQALDERLKQKAKSMNMTVHGVLESDYKGTSCGPAVSKVNLNWNWSDAVNAANLCFKARDYNAVETLANQLAIHDTSTPWGPYFFGQVALERGQLDRALWMAELSVRRAPEFGVTHYLKGQVLWAREEYKSATTEFEKAVSYDEGIGPAHLLLGQVYLRDQDYERAAEQFSAALKYLHDNIFALNGQAESEMHMNNPSRALDAYVRLTDVDETDGRYLTRIGELYEGPLNNPERALHAYQKLHDLTKAGRIAKNVDPDNDSKIKELQATLEKSRAVASTQEKSKPASKGGAK